MDESLYFRLLVIALCSVSECSQRRYHHININKTWTEAQRYCRENYTDLATVNNMNDMKQLISKVKDSDVKNNDVRFWIGLNNTGVYKWKWSMGHTVNYTNWKDKESNNTNNCAYMKAGTWHHKGCNEKLRFICYNESSKQYSYNTTTTTWRDAQRFCRNNQTDLTSVRNKTENEQIQTKINNNDHEVWIGLFSDSWEWSDKSNSTFRYWNSGKPSGAKDQCTEVLMNDQGRWNDASCSTSLTFVCHEDEQILTNTSQMFILQYHQMCFCVVSYLVWCCLCGLSHL
nr:lymphocyte antigen 75-like [Misgurnus anguillicaudatus]